MMQDLSDAHKEEEIKHKQWQDTTVHITTELQ